MYELMGIAEAILPLYFPEPGQVGEALYAALVRACPATGDGPEAEADRFDRYMNVRLAVLYLILPGAKVGPTWGPGEPVPEPVLGAVVVEVRREIVRWCGEGMFWTQAGVIPRYDYDTQTLYVNARPVGSWSGQAGRGPQLKVLGAFQDDNWARAIDTPLTDGREDDTCRRLNQRVGRHIKFVVRLDHILWRQPGHLVWGKYRWPRSHVEG